MPLSLKIIRSAALTGLAIALPLSALLLFNWWHFYSGSDRGSPSDLDVAQEIYHDVFLRVLISAFFIVLVARLLVAVLKNRFTTTFSLLPKAMIVAALGSALATVTYVAFDLREHMTMLVPVPTAEWLGDNDLPLDGGRIEYPGDTWFYPVTKTSQSVFYENDQIAINFSSSILRGGTAARAMREETVDEAAWKAISSGGIVFDVSFRTKKRDVEFDLSRLSFLEPCGPGVTRTQSGAPDLKLVRYSLKQTGIMITGPERHPDDWVRYFLIVNGKPDVIRECTIRIRDAVTSASQFPIPDVKFRAVHQSWFVVYF